MNKLIFTFLILSIFSCGGVNDESSSNNEAASVESNKEVVEEKMANWQYEEQIDQMDDSKWHYAHTASTNKLEFDFPYDGGSEFKLILRKGNKGRDVILMVDKGQFMGGLTPENIRVKFDDKEPINFTYSASDNGSSEVIFISSEKKFVSLLKSAKKLKLEPKFFEAGNRVVEFDVEGLEWE